MRTLSETHDQNAIEWDIKVDVQKDYQIGNSIDNLRFILGFRQIHTDYIAILLLKSGGDHSGDFWGGTATQPARNV